MSAEKVYQLKVTLRHITPLIWRRLLVTSDTTIAQLHFVLQIVMGWEDLHLHQFCLHGRTYGIYRVGGIRFDDHPQQVKLCDFKLRKGERFLYEYDLGAGWQHDLRLELILPLNPRKKYPVCTGGGGDCPPEDGGGPWDFRRLSEERCSWSELMQTREDVLLVAQRLLDFCQGGPHPTYEEQDFEEAIERMRSRVEKAPITFNRRAVNAALHQKEPPCTSAFK